MRSDAARQRAEAPASPAQPVERNDILDAAAACFSRKGFAATSINDIADLLTATKGMVYHHYRSKAALFFDVHICAMEMDLAAIRGAAAAGGTALDRLGRMAHAHFAMAVNETDFQRVAMQGVQMHLVGHTSEEQRRVLARILAMRDEYEALFAVEIVAALAAGSIPAQDAKTSVKAFLGVLNWVTLWYRPRPEQSAAELAAIADGTVRFALRGLGLAA
jgi:AcrR family transcriptional regulator